MDTIGGNPTTLGPRPTRAGTGETTGNADHGAERSAA
jgi:hypothetical protein